MEQTNESDQQTSASSAKDVTINSKSPNTSASSLTNRRKSGDNENTGNITSGGTFPANDVDATHNSDGTFGKEEEKKQNPKEQKHWLGPLLPARWSWVFFESPCWIWVAVCLWNFHRKKEDGEEPTVLPFQNQILLGWFSFHYIYRSLWYPLVMMKTTSARIPFGIAFLAWSYCTINGYLQARDLTYFSLHSFAANEETLPSFRHKYQFWLGLLLTVAGFYINFTSDRILQKIKEEKQRKAELRRSRQSKEERENFLKSHAKSPSSRYAVPYGGFFEYISSPHYFGELMEWTGFCIANEFSMASFSFVVWTAANLVPRAILTHKWYNETFVGSGGKTERDGGDDGDGDDNTDYSQLGRKAIIPFIL